MWRSIILLTTLFISVSTAFAVEPLVREGNLPTTSAQRLTELSQHNSWQIRRAVAGNRHSPKHLLSQMASDPDPRVRITVATNLSSPAEVHLLLLQDQSKAVRSVLARFEYISAEALNLLANDADPEIRFEVAGNWNTSIETLKRLQLDEFEMVNQRAKQELARR